MSLPCASAGFVGPASVFRLRLRLCARRGDDGGGRSWPEDPSVETAAFREQAELLAAGGVDAIFLEMITQPERGLRCVAAALTVGLPVFVGLVCSRYASNVDGSLQEGAEWSEDRPAYIGGAGREDGEESSSFASGPADESTVENVVAAVLALPGAAEGIAGFHIHHTKIYSTGHACRAVRAAGWTGPLGAYPDHGDFEMPHWQFHELSGELLVENAREGVETAGVSRLGGCCGIGPDHIEALRGLCEESTASRA